MVFGTRIGIAGTTIPVGSTGSIHMVGVFKIPKKDGEAIEKGAIVFGRWTDSHCGRGTEGTGGRICG